jgi:hypothetical protein
LGVDYPQSAGELADAATSHGETSKVVGLVSLELMLDSMHPHVGLHFEEVALFAAAQRKNPALIDMIPISMSLAPRPRQAIVPILVTSTTNLYSSLTTRTADALLIT